MDEKMKAELMKVSSALLFDEPLSRHTTIRVGGPADVLVNPKTIEELEALVLLARKNNTPIFILGAGSNLLVRDGGIRGLVITLAKSFGEIRLEDEQQDTALLYAEAGVGIPRLVDFTADEGLTGLEPISGIPGNVGGALFMNAGTPDGDIGSRVETVTFMNKEGKLQTWTAKQIKFEYRKSHFPSGAILLSARLKLDRKSSELVRGKIQKYRSHRVETQPLTVPNLGSVFKNPKEKKMFAGELIEHAGLKDVRVGGARISPKHGNWIVNEGGASARDVLALMGLMKDKVKEKFGVSLEPEVKVVGEE